MKRPGGTRQLNLDNKEITHFVDQSLGATSYDFILRTYFSELLMKAFEINSFYLKPWHRQQSLKNKGETWFECQPVNHNKLAGMLKSMLHSASIDDTNKSNHSLTFYRPCVFVWGFVLTTISHFTGSNLLGPFASLETQRSAVLLPYKNK